MTKKKTETTPEKKINAAATVVGIMLKDGCADHWRKMEALVKKYGGNVLRLCKEENYPHRTFMKWRQKMPRLESMVQAARKNAPVPDKLNRADILRRRDNGETYAAIALALGSTARKVSLAARMTS